MRKRAHGTLSELFWSKVNKTDGCWLWTAAVTDGGYGHFCRRDEDGKRRDYAAHRVGWELQVGPVPDDLFVCHRCDVRRCVRVAEGHLFLGTGKQNLADMSTKDRGGWTIAPNSIVEARRLAADGLSAYAVAKRLGISQSYAMQLMRGTRRICPELFPKGQP